MKHLLPALALIFCWGKIRAQNFNEILGRPTANSVTISALFSEVVEVKFEFGTASNNLSQSTSTFTSLPETPVVTDLQPLLPDTRYFYRTRYRLPGFIRSAA